MSDWIKVEDRLPEPTGICDGSTDRVLVFVERSYGPRIFIADGEWWEGGFDWTICGEPDRTSPYKIKKITHWKPLDCTWPSDVKY